MLYTAAGSTRVCISSLSRERSIQSQKWHDTNISSLSKLPVQSTMSSIYLRFFGKNRKGTIEKGKVKESNDQESLTQEATPLLSNRSAYGNPSKRKNGKSVAIKESRQSISL